MTAATLHWKLGLFVVLGTLVGLSAIFLLGAHTFREERETFRTYFDESVSGLDTGAVVSFRGVHVGNVAKVRVAPDARHVEVVFEMQEAILERLGLSWGKQETLFVPERLRVQLSTTGITGNKYLRLDVFEHPQPPPELPFDPGPNYIPAVSSTLKNLEDAFLRAIEELPELAGGIRQILTQTSEILGDVQQKQLPARATQLLERAERVMVVMEGAIQDLETKELSQQARATLRNLNSILVPMRAVLEQIRAPDGLIDSADRAADGLGDLMAGSEGRGDLVETLRSLREMADSVRRFTDALEQDPDMLLKGRTRERER